MVQTKCHKTSPSFIAKIEMRNRLINSLWLFIFPVASFALGFYYNNAFLYIGLMLLFLLYPFLLTVSYFNTLLLPGYASGLKPRIINFYDDSLEILYVKFDDGKETQLSNSKALNYNEISSLEIIKEHIIIKFKAGKTLVAVPFDAFYSSEDITNVVQILNHYFKK
ncbi:MAG: hypothetical protein ACI31F_03935 [Muribaculaceae bacterium]